MWFRISYYGICFHAFGLSAGVGGGIRLALLLMCFYFHNQTANTWAENPHLHFFHILRARKTAGNGCSDNSYSEMDCFP